MVRGDNQEDKDVLKSIHFVVCIKSDIETY